MELKAKDTYRIETPDFLSEDAMTSLICLYEPIIGKTSTTLYLLLHAEGRKQHNQESHARLCSLLNIGIDELERARIHLEEYLLLKCYVQESDTKNSYVYVLNAPLPSSAFLSSNVYMSIYTHAVGKKNAETTTARLTGGVSTAGFREITRRVNHAAGRETFDNDVVYTKVEPRYDFQNDDADISFDYEHFIATTSTLVFPVELRSQENLRLIGKLATVYGISADRMRILVSRCVYLDSMTFDEEKLKVLAAKTQPDITTAKDPYSLPPASFLQAKQKGTPLTMADKKILEYLSVQEHFSNEVINVMIEYILKTSDNRLVPRFVEMVAGEWARNGIRTKEDAMKYVSQNRKPSSGRRQKEDVLPAWYTKQKQGDDKPLSREEIEMLQKGIHAAGKKDEGNA